MAPKQRKSERKSERKTKSREATLKAEIQTTEKEKPEVFHSDLNRRRGTARATRSWCMNLVAQLHLLGSYSSEDISEYLEERHGIKLKPVTIRKYTSEMRRQWQEAAMQDTNTMIQQELAKIQQVETYAIGALRDGGLRVSDDGSFVQLGDAKDFCDIMLKISKRRSTLMGLDKAQKIIVTDDRTSDLSDEELETIIKAARKAKGEA